jgi:hypothetical protein
VYDPSGTATSQEPRTAVPPAPADVGQSMCIRPVSRASDVAVPTRTRPFRVRSTGVVDPVRTQP